MITNTFFNIRLWMIVFSLVAPCAASADFKPAAHPFMLWTREEAAVIRKRIETEPWARERYAAMLEEKGDGQTFRNIFRYLVMGDTSAVDAERKYLVSLIGNDPRKFLGDTGGGRHYDQYLSVLRYDALYDLLSAEERSDLESTFRDFIRHHCEEEKLRFTRTSWLPNMQWPRPLTAHLMAVALRDENLIRSCFASNGGWKYYFDDYLADGRFYGEEFGKQYSMIGEMFLWCRGVERLGLDGLGFGYTGKGGATMRGYVGSVIELGYPRIEIPGGMPQYPKLTMGDARGSKGIGGPPYVFQHSIVQGCVPGGKSGELAWLSANMNGRDHKHRKTEKMLAPHWFEIAHVKWPDAHFDYFLAQMREPGSACYVPSLFWGCAPVDAAKVKPPAAPSYLARERGFVMLRADESPAYWENAAPAVGFQLATYYVHYAHDAFSLLGFNAFNRPIYFNRQISNGYGGGCPWTDSTRGHAGVMVDNLQYQLDETDPKKDHPHWPNPIGEVPVRTAFDPLVKFISARAKPVNDTVMLDNRQPLAANTLNLDNRADEKEVWPGVDMERSLFLTREYLCDFNFLTSKSSHRYDWQIHALGNLVENVNWKNTNELGLEALYDLKNRAVATRLSDSVERDRYALKDVKQLGVADSTWTATILQSCALPDVKESVLGKAWYDRGIGVRIHMLPESSTLVFAGRTPESRATGGKEKSKGDRSDLPNEIGGTTLLVRRQSAETLFASVHEPFEKNSPCLESVRLIERTKAAAGVSIIGNSGSGVNDRVLYAFWGSHAAPVTLSGSGESFTFVDHAWLRIGADVVNVSGDARAMRIRVTGKPELRIGGEIKPARIAGGFLVYPDS